MRGWRNRGEGEVEWSGDREEGRGVEGRIGEGEGRLGYRKE